MAEIIGVLSVNMKGNSFVIPEDESADIHIKSRYLNGALNGDKVSVKIIKDKRENRAPEGEILEVIERGTKFIIGTLINGKNISILAPDDIRIKQEIYIQSKYLLNGETGDKVVAEIIKFPHGNDDIFRGKVTEVLGKSGAVGIDILSIMREYNLYEEFGEKVEKNLTEIPDFVEEKDFENRRDLRELSIVTIDGEDAKDLDDGVWAKEEENGFRLIVAIADVSHYVKENSALDNEALNRGTSVYLTDRVVPMLPKKLSNGICSLNANENRLAMVADMQINEDGDVIKSEFYPAVIKVKYRLTYNVVNKILSDKNPKFIEEYNDILEMLKTLKKLRDILFKKRDEMGAIEFQIGEIKIKLDAEGKPVAVIKRVGGLSESVIEECMLLANEEVAKFFAKKNIPAIYRVHPQPKEDTVDLLNEKISPLGYFLKKKKNAKIHPKDVQEIIKKSINTPEEIIINFTVLRAMEKAYYSEKNIGHFGLAKVFYTHFTSPIRRYPDLITHRILKEILKKNMPKDFEKALAKLHVIADKSSCKERNAIEAERAVTDLKAAEFMSNFIGEEFDGIITSVTNFGMFVELDNGIEGLVHVTNMNRDRYVYDERNFSLSGERTGEIFKLGDRVSVCVLRVNLQEKNIDFILADDAYIIENKNKEKQKKKAKSKKKKPVIFNKKNEKRNAKEKRKFYKKIANKNKRKRR